MKLSPLQITVQWVIIFSALVNTANLYINCDRYTREIQIRDRPFVEAGRPSDRSNPQ